MFITAEDARLGFGLAGIGQHVAEPHELEEVLQKAISDPEHGLIVIDERLTS
jgi:V/A-type H+-transporting ATPase subunit F